MRRLATLVAAALVALSVVPAAAAADAPAGARPACGRLDLPETGLQGEVPKADQISGRASQGYNCGVDVVGYNNLGQRGNNGNMAWSGDCAYVTGDGIAVIDVHNPAKPRMVETLHGPGSDSSIESIAAMDASNRHVLAVGRYGLIPTGKGAPVDFYDTTDCAHPKKLTTFLFPSNVHGLTITADAKRLFTTLPLQAADITDPRHPKFLGNLQPELLALKVNHNQYAHEAWPSPDGHWLYIGGQTAAEGENEELLILDIRNWPRRPLRLVGRTHLPGHSIRSMTINGKAYLLNSDESIQNNESKGCVPSAANPFAGVSAPYITDISNAYRPHAVSQFHLAINEPRNCVQEIADGTDASVHYHDVDDPDRTTFALLSMWNAGMRIVDVRNPLHPSEVAYFNPGKFARPASPIDPVTKPYPTFFGAFTSALDQTWAHIRYQPSTGLIWLATQSGGFWVLELEPQVRAALGLPPTTAYHAHGGSPRPEASDFSPHPTAAGTLAPMYCTIGPVSFVTK